MVCGTDLQALTLNGTTGVVSSSGSDAVAATKVVSPHSTAVPAVKPFNTSAREASLELRGPEAVADPFSRGPALNCALICTYTQQDGTPDEQDIAVSSGGCLAVVLPSNRTHDEHKQNSLRTVLSDSAIKGAH